MEAMWLPVVCGLFLLNGLVEGQQYQATCTVSPATGVPSQAISGTITLTQVGSGPVSINVQLSGFSTVDGIFTHGFHIHEVGDVSNQCASAGGHYNPFNSVHGAPTSETRHVGDLGNIQEVNGAVNQVLSDSVISLFGSTPNNVIGRSIVIHANQDDFVTDPTGNAGARLGCCVIVSSTTPVTSPGVASVATVVHHLAPSHLTGVFQGTLNNNVLPYVTGQGISHVTHGLPAGTHGLTHGATGLTSHGLVHGTHGIAHRTHGLVPGTHSAVLGTHGTHSLLAGTHGLVPGTHGALHRSHSPHGLLGPHGGAAVLHGYPLSYRERLLRLPVHQQAFLRLHEHLFPLSYEYDPYSVHDNRHSDIIH